MCKYFIAIFILALFVSVRNTCAASTSVQLKTQELDSDNLMFRYAKSKDFDKVRDLLAQPHISNHYLRHLAVHPVATSICSDHPNYITYINDITHRKIIVEKTEGGLENIIGIFSIRDQNLHTGKLIHSGLPKGRCITYAIGSQCNPALAAEAVTKIIDYTFEVMANEENDSTLIRISNNRYSKEAWEKSDTAKYTKHLLGSDKDSDAYIISLPKNHHKKDQEPSKSSTDNTRSCIIS